MLQELKHYQFKIFLKLLATKQSKIVVKVGKAGTKHEYEYNFREKRKK